MARQTQTSQLDTRSDVSDTSVAIQCLVAYSQSFTGAGSFNTRFFLCSASRLGSGGIRRDEKFFITFRHVWGSLFNSSPLEKL